MKVISKIDIRRKGFYKESERSWIKKWTKNRSENRVQ